MIRNAYPKSLRLALLAAFLLPLAGCKKPPQPQAGSGARESVLSFYNALVHRDWPVAYATLDPAGGRRPTLDQFSLAAERYVQRLGFSVKEVAIQGCEEHGPQALAHVVLRGDPTAKPSRFNDAVSLRRDGQSWLIVLPPTWYRTTK